MTFEEIKQTISQYAQENDTNEAVSVELLVEENQIIERLTYPVFMNLTMDFLQQKFSKLKLDNLQNLLNDMQVSQDYLSRKISAKQLENHRVVAWKRHDKLTGNEKHAQRLTICLLYPSLLDNKPDPSDQFTTIEILTDYLSLISHELCVLYYWKLYKNLPE